MTLPASFAKDGFLSPQEVNKTKFKRFMLATEGWSESGKTEFAMSAPGPGVILSLDRGTDWLDNPHPPATRRNDFALKLIPRFMPHQVKQEDFQKNWMLYYELYLKAVNNPDCRTIIVDTDSDTWELQRLAEYGRVQGVMPLQYQTVNANRKAMWARAWDAGKIIIAINRLKDEYTKSVNKEGKEITVPTGGEERQGWPDQEYLFGMQIRHFKNEHGQFGLKILKCKANSEWDGLELVGEDCNFKSLVNVVYPQIDDKIWGY
jgi:hypothetical protein